ncbi:hypothetical protein Hanom_Chr00s109863g01807271 [Helianthus anomalus]
MYIDIRQNKRRPYFFERGHNQTNIDNQQQPHRGNYRGGWNIIIKKRQTLTSDKNYCGEIKEWKPQYFWAKPKILAGGIGRELIKGGRP